MIASLFVALGSVAWSAPPVVDLHLDTPTQLYQRGLALDAPSGLEAGLSQLKEGQVNLVMEVLWPAPRTDGPTRVDQLYSVVMREIERLPELVLVTSPERAREVAASNQIGIMLSMEGAHGLREDWRSDLDSWQERGLRWLGVTWSFSNRFAGSSGDGGGGLTEEGRALVERCGALGIGLDVSHASPQATLEICSLAGGPVIASHSNAARQHPHHRNLSDEAIRCIAGSGGVIGVNLHTPFLGGAGDLQAVADQVEALAAVGGKGVVALGSDFDGFIRRPKEIADAGDWEALWTELRRRGWTEAELRGLQGENFLRSWEALRASEPGTP